MNETVNKFFLAWDKLMPEMHLRQPGFTYTACELLTKNKGRIKKFKETGDSKYIYQNKLDKACFQHDMGYENFKDLNRRTAADKVLRDKDPKYDGYQRRLASFVCKFYGKETSSSGIKNIANKELAKELHKPIKEKYTHLLLTILGVHI